MMPLSLVRYLSYPKFAGAKRMVVSQRLQRMQTFGSISRLNSMLQAPGTGSETQRTDIFISRNFIGLIGLRQIKQNKTKKRLRGTFPVRMTCSKDVSNQQQSVLQLTHHLHEFPQVKITINSELTLQFSCQKYQVYAEGCNFLVSNFSCSLNRTYQRGSTLTFFLTSRGVFMTYQCWKMGG